MKSLKTAILISRPVYWPPFTLLLLIGMSLSGGAIRPTDILGAALLAFPYCLWFGSVNDLADRETDSHNQYKGGISGPKESADEKFLITMQWLSLAILTVATLATRNPQLIAAAAVAIFVPYAYSAPPLRLKGRPPLDSLSNGVFLTSIMICGVAYRGGDLLANSVMSFASGVFLSVTALHIIGALRDYSADRQAGLGTIATILGPRTSALAASILFALTFAAMHTLFPAYDLANALSAFLTLVLTFRPNERLSLQLGLLMVTSYCMAGLLVLLQ